MSESMVELDCKSTVTRVPDHSLLCWQVVAAGIDETKENECESGKRRKLGVSEGYLQGEVERLANLRN